MGAIGIRHGLQHLERRRGISAHGTQHRRRLNTAHAVGVGHGHALDVFDDVARAPNLERLRLAPQHQAGKRRRICHGDGFGAAQRADELAVQQIAQGLIALALVHLVDIVLYGVVCHDDLLACKQFGHYCTSFIQNV